MSERQRKRRPKPKRDLVTRRTIVVKGIKYYWEASGQDFYIQLRIKRWEDPKGPRVNTQEAIAYFHYHHRPRAFRSDPPDTEREHARRPSQQMVVTPYIVRQTIEHARRQGWTPDRKAQPLYLGCIDDRIDIRVPRLPALSEIIGGLEALGPITMDFSFNPFAHIVLEELCDHRPEAPWVSMKLLDQSGPRHRRVARATIHLRFEDIVRYECSGSNGHNDVAMRFRMNDDGTREVELATFYQDDPACFVNIVCRRIELTRARALGRAEPG